MKVFTTILLLSAVLFMTTTARGADVVKTPSNPLELVLNCDISFDTAADVRIGITYRNVGVTNVLYPMTLTSSLIIVWDGKDYKLQKLTWTGPAKLFPLQGMTIHTRLLNYNIPAEALTAGRHSIAFKVALIESDLLSAASTKSSKPTTAAAESNMLTTATLTVFIGKEYRAVGL